MALITYTISNLVVKIDPAYCPVNGDLQFSFAASRYSWDPAYAITSITLYTPTGGSTVLTYATIEAAGRDFTGIGGGPAAIDLATTTLPGPRYTAFSTMFGSPGSLVWSASAATVNDIAICKYGSDHMLITASYGKNVGSVLTPSKVSSVVMVVDSGALIGPLLDTATAFTLPNEGSVIFPGEPQEFA